MNAFILFLLVALSVLVECHEGESTNVEARGKGAYALLISFFYVVTTKIFILKIVYGIIFYVLLSKGWKFVIWFVQYLKNKDHHVEYIEHDHHGHHDYHDYHGHHDHFETPYHGYDPYYGHEKNGYGFKEFYPQNLKGVYDSDGSYSVKNPVTRG